MITIDQINNIKKSLNITSQDLSEKSGVPYGTLVKMLSGQIKSPSANKMAAIEESLAEFAKNEQGFADFSAFFPDISRKTIKDYYALPEDARVELIDGKFYAMASPSVLHQKIVGNLYYAFRSYIEKQHGSCTPFISPMDVQLDEDNDTMLQPDFMIVCDANKILDNRIKGAPDLVVEVVSPATKARDYIIKLEKYKSAGVREYWIIDTNQNRALVYQNMDLNEDVSVMIYSLQDIVPVGIFDGMEVDLRKMSCNIW